MRNTLIDRKSLDRFTEHDSEMVADLAVIFNRELPDYLARMDYSIAESDLEAVGEIAHQLKSQLSYFFCESLVNLAIELEEHSSQGATSEAKSTATKLTEGIDQLLEELNQLTGLNLTIEKD